MKFVQCPRVNINAAFIVLAEVHELLRIVLLFQDILSEVTLFGLSLQIGHSVRRFSNFYLSMIIMIRDLFIRDSFINFKLLITHLDFETSG